MILIIDFFLLLIQIEMQRYKKNNCSVQQQKNN